MSSFTIRQGDTKPDLNRTLEFQDVDGAWKAINLTTATSVTFRMKHWGNGTLKVERTATIVAPSTGAVRHAWLAADTNEAGTFQAEWEIDFNGDIQTVPNGDYDVIEVTRQLG